MARPVASVVLLAVDAAATSGVALMMGRSGYANVEYTDTVVVRSRAVEEIVRRAVVVACEVGLPLYLAVESTPGSSKMGPKQLLGMAESRGAWKREFLVACAEYKTRIGGARNGRRAVLSSQTSRVVMVSPATWRAAVIERRSVVCANGGKRRLTPEEEKEEAMAMVLKRHGLVLGPDAADAVCIGDYAIRDLGV